MRQAAFQLSNAVFRADFGQDVVDFEQVLPRLRPRRGDGQVGCVRALSPQEKGESIEEWKRRRRRLTCWTAGRWIGRNRTGFGAHVLGAFLKEPLIRVGGFMSRLPLVQQVQKYVIRTPHACEDVVEGVVSPQYAALALFLVVRGPRSSRYPRYPGAPHAFGRVARSTSRLIHPTPNPDPSPTLIA